MTKCELEKRRSEIATIINDIRVLEYQLTKSGIDARDPEDRLEAMDILNRLERRILARLPPK